MKKICTNTSHRGGSRLRNCAWRCTLVNCGGIQAWRAHEEETRRDVLADTHRWEGHFNLPLSPTTDGFDRFTTLGNVSRLRHG